MTSFLSGVRVLDLTRMLAGPYCTMLMADMGAEVIKIEHPEGGDEIRKMGPPFVKGESAYFISINRNKLSMTLNLRKPEGRSIFLRMVEKSDVIVENFRPGVMKRLELDYPVLKARNSGIIACSISGYGQTGPYKDRPAYDLVLQAMGGVVGLTGEPGGKPVRCGLPIGDLGGALMASFAVVNALFAREKTGKGAYIDISLMDSLIFLAPYIAQYYFADGEITKPSGSKHRSVVPYQVFETMDVYIVVAVFGKGFWKRFCEAIERPDLVSDPRFATNEERVAHRDILEPELEKVMKTRRAHEWLEILKEHEIPSCEVKTIDKVLQDPQLKARDAVVKMEHPTCGTISTLVNPIKVNGSTGEIHHSPLLGEHTNDILSGVLNLTPTEIEALHKKGVV